tara:strand:- start:21206 stop:21406 length:201 start_codon:yes stop_codon:yes gene_type:complete
MSKEEVAAIMSLAAKIIQHQDNKELLQELQDESATKLVDLKVLRKSEDYHDMTGRPGPGNCDCHKV